MKKTPKLRFKEFRGDWKEKRFSTIFLDIKNKTSDTVKYPLYSLTIENGVIPKTERYEREFLVTKGEENFKVVNKDEFVYNPMNLRFGALARHKEYKVVSVSGYYNVFKVIDNSPPCFWDNYLKTNRMMYIYNTIATGSLIEKRRVHFSQFIELNLPIPTIKEQEKISTLFSLIDEKICLQLKKVNDIKDYKKGISQKIFNQELRFKDDNGEAYPMWNKEKLINLTEKITTKNKDFTITNVISNSAKNGLISQRDFFDKDIANQSNIDGYYVIEPGDFVYNPRKSSESPYGPINRYELQDAGVVSPLYLCFRVNSDEVDGKFLSYYFKSSVWYRFIYLNSDQGARHDRVSIKDAEFFNMEIAIPMMDEQNKIVKFLDSLELKLNKEQGKLDYLTEYKKGLLQQMFI